MAGTQPRKQPLNRLASSTVRRAPVGLGTPGVSGVRRRDGSQALTVPPASGGDFTPRWSKFTNSGNQTLSDASVIGFTSTRTDTGDMAAVTYSAGQLVLGEPGLYVVQANFVTTTTPNAGGIGTVTFQGTIPNLYAAFMNTTASAWRTSITAVIPVATNDYIYFEFRTPSASSTTFNSFTKATVARIF